MPEEVRFWLRIAGFGFAIAAVYWIVSQDITGTVLLATFGLSGGYLAAMLVVELRRVGRRLHGRPWTWIGLAGEDDRGLDHDEGRLPGATFGPLVFGMGIAIAALGLVYGAFLIVAAAPLLLIGARRWYHEASAELVMTERTSAAADVTRRS